MVVMGRRSAEEMEGLKDVEEDTDGQERSRKESVTHLKSEVSAMGDAVAKLRAEVQQWKAGAPKATVTAVVHTRNPLLQADDPAKTSSGTGVNARRMLEALDVKLNKQVDRLDERLERRARRSGAHGCRRLGSRIQVGWQCRLMEVEGEGRLLAVCRRGRDRRSVVRGGIRGVGVRRRGSYASRSSSDVVEGGGGEDCHGEMRWRDERAAGLTAVVRSRRVCCVSTPHSECVFGV